MSSIEHKETDFILNNPDVPDADMDVPQINVPGVKTYRYWLYALYLDDDTYYIGYTKLPNPYDRITQQGTDLGAKWLIKHQPIKVVEIRDLGIISEQSAKLYGEKLRTAYMKTYGYKKIAMKSYFLHPSYKKNR